jgi:hypothetical protein
MSQTIPTGQLPPVLPTSITPFLAYRGDTLTPGEEDPYIMVINGPATMVYFTDQAGNPIDGPTRCGMNPHGTPLPPCDIGVGLTKSKMYITFSGTLSPSMETGNYVFYIRAENMVGKSNVCECQITVKLRPEYPPSAPPA